MALSADERVSLGLGGNSESTVGNPSGTGSDEIGIPTADPAELGTTAGTGGSGDAAGDGGKPRRGRRPGSGKPAGTGKKAASVSVTGLEKLLLSLHGMAAAALKVDELNIDNEEAKLLSGAMAEVASHYNVEVDPKIMAWIGLIGVAGSIYGPRFAAVRLRKEIERRQRESQNRAQPFEQARPAQQDTAQVFQMSEVIIPQPL